MNDLLNNPLFQSALLPFLVSLVALFVLRPLGWFWAGLAGVIGFAATVYLLTDFQFFPLRSDRKILLLGTGGILLGLLLDLLPWRRIVPWILFIAAVGAALWLVWPRFRFVEGGEFWSLALAGPAYVAWLLLASEGLRNKPVQADSAVFALALGTGLSALLGATALYGQLAAAIAAAIGPRLLFQAAGKPVAAGSIMLVPLVAVIALLGLGAVVYAKLPWYSLTLLALIPALIWVPLPANLPRLLHMAFTVMIALVPAGLAIFFTWRETGAPPI